MICAHLGPNGHSHVVNEGREARRVCGGCRLVICYHHDDCEPEAAA